MPKKTEELNLECALTNPEKLDYSKDLAENINRKARAEDSLKAYKSQAKSEIEGHEAKINLLSQKISSGMEYRMVECSIEYDWNNKTRTWVRLDTGEIAKDDIIPESMLQQKMSLK